MKLHVGISNSFLCYGQDKIMTDKRTRRTCERAKRQLYALPSLNTKSASISSLQTYTTVESLTQTNELVPNRQLVLILRLLYFGNH